MTYGKSTLVLAPGGSGRVYMELLDSGTSISWPLANGWKFPILNECIHVQLQISVTTDPNLKSIVVNWYGDQNMIDHYVAGNGPAVVQSTRISPGSPLPVVTVAKSHSARPTCQSPLRRQ